jgi:hypothetical protein
MSTKGREPSNGIAAKSDSPETKKSKDAASGPDGESRGRGVGREIIDISE